MKKLNLKELYKKQISLSEWFENMNHPRSAELREEDNKKRERLAVIHEITGLPFDRPESFKAIDLAQNTENWQEYLRKHGDEMCALRLIPLDPNLPKLRMRGDTVKGVFEGWFQDQNIDASKYQADVVPHCKSYTWSTIFVVNDQGIFGEIVRGTHAQLTQGFHEDHAPYSFSYDWNDLLVSGGGDKAKNHLQMIMDTLIVTDEQDRELLKQKVEAQFTHNYLKGYFETVHSNEFKLWFIDYNRILGKIYADFSPNLEVSTKGSICGRSASTGKLRGMVCIMHNASDAFRDGDILVCSMTTPEFLPAMQRASAVITDQGGILSHAAITSRELGIPCIVGCQNAVELLKDGDEILMDANQGIVRIV